MACSPECFEEYMKRIEESRRPKVNVEKKSVAKKVKPEKNKPCVEMDETSDENNNLLKE